MRRRIMFVTYLTDGFQKAFAYTTELARMMEKDVDVLIISKKQDMTGKIDDYMTAVTFAKSGEQEVAKEFMSGNGDHDFSEEINYLWEKCSETGTKLSIHRSGMDIVTAINTFVSQEKGVDMILIGSSITDNGSISAKELKRLVRTASRPVVTIGEEARVG
jgi:hypothetical protein